MEHTSKKGTRKYGLEFVRYVFRDNPVLYENLLILKLIKFLCISQLRKSVGAYSERKRLSLCNDMSFCALKLFTKSPHTVLSPNNLSCTSLTTYCCFRLSYTM